MELQDFIQNFAEQFEDTNASEIQSNTIFRELEEWTSLTGLSVIAMIDSEYGVTVSGQELRSCETIERLFNLVQSKE